MLLKSVLIGSVVAMSARLAVAAGEVEVAIDTSKLTESETKFETEFFNEVDADSNKLMSRRELKHYFVQQELGYGDEDLNMVVGYYYKDKDGVKTDTDGDDAISWNEYLGLKLRQKQRMAARYASKPSGEVRVIAEDGEPTEAAAQEPAAPARVDADSEPPAAAPRWDEL